MNVQLVIMLVAFAFVALYLGIGLVKVVNDMQKKPITFVIAFLISGMVGLNIAYLIIHGLPEQGLEEFYGDYMPPLILLGILSFPGFLYFVVNFDGGWKFISTAILVGVSIGMTIYDLNYWVGLTTVVFLSFGFFTNRFIHRVRNNC